MFKILVSMFTVFMGFQLHAQDITCDQANTGKMSYQMLTSILEKCNPASVEELLKVLPIHFRLYASFIHSSRSLQKSTKERPRVLLGQLDDQKAVEHRGRFVAAFGGDPKLKGYETFEFFELNEQDEFDFGAVEFPKEIDPNWSGPNYILSQKNPAKCLNCHKGSPIWDTYFHWSNFMEAKPDNNLGMNVLGKIGRYKHIPLREYNGPESFSYITNWLQGMHIVSQTKKEMAADPWAARFRFILAALDNLRSPRCKPKDIMKDFIPPEVLAKFPMTLEQATAKFEEINTSTRISINRRKCGDFNYMRGTNEDCTVDNPMESLFPEFWHNNSFLLFAATNANLNFKNWSMVRVPGLEYTFAFRDNDSAMGENESNFRELLSKEEQAEIPDGNCTAYAEASRKAFSDLVK